MAKIEIYGRKVIPGTFLTIILYFCLQNGSVYADFSHHHSLPCLFVAKDVKFDLEIKRREFYQNRSVEFLEECVNDCSLEFSGHCHSVLFRKEKTGSEPNCFLSKENRQICPHDFVELLLSCVPEKGHEVLADCIFCDEKAKILERQKALGTLSETTCGPYEICANVRCDLDSKYRTLTGCCNNPKFESLGAVNIAFARLLPNEYEDGIDAPRSRSADGEFLPNPRTISGTIGPDEHRRDQTFTEFITHWGQFLAHDFSRTELFTDDEGRDIHFTACGDCRTDIRCSPIPIPSKDPFYRLSGKRCIEFVRSKPIQRCSTREPRQQRNLHSAFLDGSVIYGSQPGRSRTLRAYRDGELKSVNDPEAGMLPPPLRVGMTESCMVNPPTTCFQGGDDRANENIGLAALHSVWLREHNRIAKKLSLLNPAWTDQTLFEETRRIVSAVLQHITYNEYIPKIVGPAMSHKYDIRLLNSGYYNAYDPYCDPSISNEFATAAFRFGHSMIPPVLRVVDPYYGNIENISLHLVIGNPSQIYRKHFLDGIILGFTDQQCTKFDLFINTILLQHLEQRSDKSFSGRDLYALNIQRGRDHGIAPWIKYREKFGLKVPTSWQDAKSIFTSEAWEILGKAYDIDNNPEAYKDFDIFPGIMAEKPMFGAIVGESIGNIIGDQFERLRKCDRFWYENGGQSGSFSPEQLEQIRRYRLSAVFCNNLPFIKTLPQDVFLLSSESSRLSCEEILERFDMDFSSWKE